MPEKLSIRALVNGEEVGVLVDTGAQVTVVSKRLTERIRGVETAWRGPELRMADGRLSRPTKGVTYRVRVGSKEGVVRAVVVDTAHYDVLLGLDFLEEIGAVIDLRDRSVVAGDEIRAPLREPAGIVYS